MTKKHALSAIRIAKVGKKFKNPYDLAAQAIICDLGDRGGFKGIISDILYEDPSIILEIKKTFSYIIKECLKSYTEDGDSE